MAQPHKRKFDAHQETLLRPEATPEVQELYNKLRHMEESELGLGMLPFRDEMGNRDQQGQLLPPSPSQATSRSRSPSCASTTQSVTRGIAKVEIEKDQPQTKKRRPVRTGPLDEYTKTRAALVRKIGACQSCRDRKVKCDHIDRSHLEEGYQLEKRRQKNAEMRRKHPVPRVKIPAQSQNTELLNVQSMSPYFPSLSHETDLVGVAHNPAGATPYGLGEGPYNPNLEVDIDTAQPSRGRPLPASLSPLYNSSRTPVIPGPGPLLYSPPTPNIPMTTVRDERVLITLGRQVAQGHCECLFNSDEEGSVSSGGQEPCTIRFNTVDQLWGHFNQAHMPFSNPVSMWKCTNCKFIWPEQMMLATCPQCQGDLPQRQKWHFGHIIRSSSVPSLPSARVPSQDGSPLNRTMWPTSPGNRSNSSPGGQSLSGGAYGGGGANRGGQMFTFSTAGASPVNLEIGPMDYQPSLSSSHMVEKKRSSPTGSSHYYGWDSGGSKTTVFSAKTTIADPFQAMINLRIALTVLSFVLMGGLWSAGSSWILARRALLDAAALIFSFVPELSVGLIAVGLVGMWLLRHFDVEMEMRQHGGSVQPGRCVMRSVVGCF